MYLPHQPEISGRKNIIEEFTIKPAFYLLTVRETRPAGQDIP